MEGGVPILNCLIQHSLRSLCTSTDFSNTSKWIYAVYWRVIPRNYPPPKWDHGGAIDRGKSNKRNWMLVWEDGFLDFYACEQAGSGYLRGKFGADIFFKMSHEVYSLGEGLVGKIAADNSHKWVYRDGTSEKVSSFISSWNVCLEPQPRAWEAQFESGIQTIALVSVRDGIIQLGSFDKVPEDPDLVISIRRKFSYIQSVPCNVKTIQRQSSPNQYLHTFRTNDPYNLMESKEPAYEIDGTPKVAGLKRLYNESESPKKVLKKSIDLGHNSFQDSVFGPPHLWTIPPLLPSVSYSLGVHSSKIPFVSSSDQTLDSILLNHHCNNQTAGDNAEEDADESARKELQYLDVKREDVCELEATQKVT